MSSAIWKERFISRYDYAYVRNPTEYAIAYRLRRFVLGQFVAFTSPRDKRLMIQLEVLKDMILGECFLFLHCPVLMLTSLQETYLQPRPQLAPPLTSHNLAAFASPGNSPWMRTFLSCFFFPRPGHRYGQPHPVFDALQLVLSHLLLSPESKMAHVIDSSRENYDLAVVYNWNKPFSTLFRRLSEREEDSAPVQLRRRAMFPNLQSRKSIRRPRAPQAKYELDTHALLHIRNFWHRHLIDDSARLAGFKQPGLPGENTYAKMARDLRSAGITAKMWDHPLRDELPQMATEWYGHWSCVHPWPKKRRALEEMQSCAEDWKSIDPMKLDFSVITDNQEYGYWSPIFNAIPAFTKTIPESEGNLFIRGLAPFVELPSSHEGKAFTSTSTRPRATLTVPKLPKYHPYLALRIRGIIHPIPSQQLANRTGLGSETGGIPGWNRIVMVLYKPSKRYLIQVLEHAEEEYGGQFGPIVTSQLLQTGQIQPAAQQQQNPGGGGQPADVDAAVVEAQLESYLRDKLVSNPDWRDPARMDREVIENMEEKFRLSEFLEWADIDYAYAYEGVILPGGKIMMGRWWRCGMFGLGDGMELGADGQPVDPGAAAGQVDGHTAHGVAGAGPVDADAVADADADADDGLGSKAAAAAADGTPGSGDGRENAPNVNRDQKLERGPFIFWC